MAALTANASNANGRISASSRNAVTGKQRANRRARQPWRQLSRSWSGQAGVTTNQEPNQDRRREHHDEQPHALDADD